MSQKCSACAGPYSLLPSRASPHRSNRQTGAGERGVGSGPTPFFHCRFPAGGFPVTDSLILQTALTLADLQSQFGVLVPALSHFQERVCPAKVFCMCSPILITPRQGPPLLEAIGRRGPGGGSPDLTPPRFSTAGSRRAGSRPPAPAFSDPRPSRRTSTAPPENTFAPGTPLQKCFPGPHPFDPASRTRPPFPIPSPYCRISRRNLLSPGGMAGGTTPCFPVAPPVPHSAPIPPDLQTKSAVPPDPHLHAQPRLYPPPCPSSPSPSPRSRPISS